MSASLDSSPLLADWQIEALRQRLQGRLVSLSFGAGVDSTAMLVALREAGLVPQLISMADTGGEKPETMRHVDRVNEVLQAWGWPSVTMCKKATKPGTGYDDLYGNCLANETLPSLAFGMKSCSLKWKTSPQDQMLRGVSKGPNRRDPHPLWRQAKAQGERIVKLIGYDCGKSDLRRSKAVNALDADFEYVYPLQILRWARPDCVSAIALGMGPHLVPIKSACFFCPASKHWELFWLPAVARGSHWIRSAASAPGGSWISRSSNQPARPRSGGGALQGMLPRPQGRPRATDALKVHRPCLNGSTASTDL